MSDSNQLIYPQHRHLIPNLPVYATFEILQELVKDSLYFILSVG
ncbi:hypothetical protein OOU_Y34scaffold01093g2 [Pyricularia oryzae Y34]|uniref:Uncharacterized protein n=1 Tax=Pyricularia oryzae (strain Y34) TaxID=1143189 RepID=A0AA97NLX0_PYRO3|nr:hypothetical protein OOU_Y34scaffold01093g2 [Pyricularia oryzae Y34]